MSDMDNLRRMAQEIHDMKKSARKDRKRIAKLEAAIRGCMEQEGFDDTQEAFEWWVSDNQPDEIRTVKGE